MLFFFLSADYTRHRLFTFTQQGQGWSITIVITQVHACHSSFLSLATDLSLFHFLFQFFSLIFFFLGFNFLNLFFFVFFSKFFSKIFFHSSPHLHLANFLLERFCNFLATLIFLIFIFYVLLITIFLYTLYALLLQHNLCNTLYLLLMQIF